MRSKQLALLAILILAATFAFYNQKALALKTIDLTDALVYVPGGNTVVPPNMPVLVAFSPDANAAGLIEFWAEFADKYNFLIYASKLYKNGIYSDVMHKFTLEVYSGFYKFASDNKIDNKRIIFTGLSGGGSFSYQLNYTAPQVASVLIINTGRIWEDSPFYTDINQDINSVKKKFPNPPLVVFIASPTDFRYKNMKRDREFIAKLGWQYDWQEFEGGHKLAPKALYTKVLDIIFSQPNWKH